MLDYKVFQQYEECVIFDREVVTNLLLFLNKAHFAITTAINRKSRDDFLLLH